MPHDIRGSELQVGDDLRAKQERLLEHQRKTTHAWAEAEAHLAAARQSITALRAVLTTVESEITAALYRNEAQCFTVDVRATYGSLNPVLGVVVSHSDVMHDLLFLRKRVRAALTDPPKAQP